MFTCPNCGAQMEDTDTVCAACGYTKEAAANDAAYTKEDIEKNKVFGILGYIFPILFFLPLVVNKDSAYGRFIANQMLVAFIVRVILGVVGTILGIIPIIGLVIMALLNLVGLAIMVIGIIYVVKGEAKKLPYIGGITIIK